MERQDPNALKQWRKESGAETLDHAWAPAQDVHDRGGVSPCPSLGAGTPLRQPGGQQARGL